MLQPSEVFIEVFRSGIGQPQHVKVTHQATGISSEAIDNSQIRARDFALGELTEKVKEHEREASVEG